MFKIARLLGESTQKSFVEKGVKMVDLAVPHNLPNHGGWII